MVKKRNIQYEGFLYFFFNSKIREKIIPIIKRIKIIHAPIKRNGIEEEGIRDIKIEREKNHLKIFLGFSNALSFVSLSSMFFYFPIFFSFSATLIVVFTIVSGLRDIDSIPSSTRNSANSG